MRSLRPLLVLPLQLARLLAQLLVIVPLRTSFALLAFSARTTAHTTRLAVRSSLVAFLAGLGLGWLLGTPTGRQMLADARSLVRGDEPPTDAELAERVRAELRGSASTWHLVQPGVDAVAGIVTLSGEVPHDQARSDLVAVVGAVPGVEAVADRLVVAVTEG